MSILSNMTWNKGIKSSQTLFQIYKDSSAYNLAIIDATEEFLSTYTMKHRVCNQLTPLARHSALLAFCLHSG